MSTPIPSRFIIFSAIAIAALAIFASCMGLLAGWPYAQETENWRHQAWGQDIGNLLAVVVLIWGLIMMRRRSPRSPYILLGTLFYFIYAYLVYAVTVHFNAMFPAYVIVLGLAVYATASLFPALVTPQIVPRGARKFSGMVLAVVGGLFGMLWVGEIVPALLDGTVPKSILEAGLVTNPIYVIDLAVVLPAFLATGVLTLKNRSKGLTYVAPWLVFSALMATSIVATMVIYLLSGNSDIIIPLAMMTFVMIFSLFAAVKYLRVVR